ncbi:MAG: hypothetical protein ACYTGW_13465 [Planctomycetota bacterium]|jgi:hypothetical protein
MRPLAAFLFPTLLVSVVGAQSSIILPKPARSVKADINNSTTVVPFYGHTNTAGTYGRFQYFYDVNTIPATAAVFKAIAWRETALQRRRAMPATSGNYKISMDVVPAKHNQVSTTFSNNYSTNPARKTVVFDGKISFPAVTIGTGTWPMKWQPTLPFNKSTFAYVKTFGQSLMVETEASTTVPNTGFPYAIEAYRNHDGRRGTNEANTLCMNRANSRPTTATHDDSGLTSIFVPNLHPGGHWQMTAFPYPKNSSQFKPSFCVLGLQGKGGKYLGQTLPTTFPPIGLLATDNVNCKLGNSLDALLPATYNATAGTVQGPKIPVPTGSQFIGASFYAQMVSNDNGLIFPSFSHKLTVNAGNPPGGTSLGVLFKDPKATLPTSGSFGSQSVVATWRLDS